MEKILLKNNTTLDIHKISNNGNNLEITFLNADIIELENIFSASANLEKIILQDENDTVMTVYKNYAVFNSIRKDKNVEIDVITELKADVITVSLNQEPEWIVENRKLKEQLHLQDGAIMDLGNIVSTMATSEGEGQ